MSDDAGPLGEFQLIRRLLDRLPAARALPLGPGDDAAIIEERGSRAILATADLLVEGSHFDRAFSSMRDIGFKALACNVSDIAAMGGRPTIALVSIGCDRSNDVKMLESLYDGIGDAARAFGVTIAGGDTVVSDALIVSIAMLGEAEQPVTRAGARPGDVLCVTGALGGAAAGLHLLRSGTADARAAALLERFPSLAEAHRRGRARLDEGVTLAAMGARAMIDVSDGLGRDVGHLCEESVCGAVIEARAIPLALGVAEAAAWEGRAPHDVALDGGDDYELAVALAPAAVEHARAAIAPTPLTVIGRFVEGAGVTLDDGTDVGDRGWDHLS